MVEKIVLIVQIPKVSLNMAKKGNIFAITKSFNRKHNHCEYYSQNYDQIYRIDNIS